MENFKKIQPSFSQPIRLMLLIYCTKYRMQLIHSNQLHFSHNYRCMSQMFLSKEGKTQIKCVFSKIVNRLDSCLTRNQQYHPVEQRGFKVQFLSERVKLEPLTKRFTHFLCICLRVTRGDTGGWLYSCWLILEKSGLVSRAISVGVSKHE